MDVYGQYRTHSRALSDLRDSVDDGAIAIQMIGLTKRYGTDVLAVDDFELVVYEGEIFDFLGPNGAGKSTTIDVIMDCVRHHLGVHLFSDSTLRRRREKSTNESVFFRTDTDFTTAAPVGTSQVCDFVEESR